MANRIAVYEGYTTPSSFEGYKRRRRGGKRHCRFGVAKSGRRKGQCLKSRRSRR